MGTFIERVISFFDPVGSMVQISQEDYNRLSTGDLESLLLEQRGLNLKAESVFDKGNSEDSLSNICSLFSSFDNGVFLVCNGIGQRIGTAEKYVKVFGVESRAGFQVSKDLKQPFLMPIVTTHVVSPFFGVDENAIATFNVGDSFFDSKRFGLYVFYSGKKEIDTFSDYANWPMPFNTLNLYRPCLGYINKYDSDFEMAADVLHKSHPELGLDNVRIWLKQHFIHELRNLDSIDIWQDISACREIGCDYLEQFNDYYTIISESEKLYMAWKMATTARNNLLKQGFGPGQIILGLAMEAAGNEEVASKYVNFIPKDAFTDEKAMLNAILHPVYSIYIKAMTYDYLLTRMKETVFKSEAVGFASDVYPFIGLNSTAREMALINMAQVMSMYPERDNKLRSYVYSGPDMQMFNNFCVYAKMLNIEPVFPGLVCKADTFESLGYTSDFEGRGSMDGIITNDMDWTVYTMQPGFDFNVFLKSLSETFGEIGNLFLLTK